MARDPVAVASDQQIRLVSLREGTAGIENGFKQVAAGANRTDAREVRAELTTAVADPVTTGAGRQGETGASPFRISTSEQGLEFSQTLEFGPVVPLPSG